MGLSPQYYDECTDDVLNLYAELEDRIIADVVRRIVKTGDITETAKWQIRQAQQMGLLYDDIIKDVAQYTSKTDSEVKKMFENAGVETVSNDNRIHLLAGNSPLDIRQSESMLQILNAVYKERLTDLQNLTGTTAITSQTAYYNACNSAFMMVSSGAFSYQQALRTVIQEVAENGTTVTYPSGHVDKLDVAVRRSLLTGIGLASRQISEENSRLCGCDLMEISAHSGARPSHAAWQGQIVSLSGRKGYLSKSDIGYGTGAGFGGWNCRHDWYPFYEGISSRNYSKKDLEKLNAKDIEYKGKMYSEYEISQMLRKKEREIRALKREKTAYNTAITETSDKQLKAVFQSALTYTNSAIRDKSAEIKQFCADTGYRRDRFREQIVGKTSVGHGFGELSKQNQKFNLKNSLTSILNSGKMSVEHKIKWLKKGTELTSEQKRELVLYAKNKNIVLTGLNRTDVDIVLIKEVIDDAEKMLKIYPELNSNPKQPFTIKVVNGMLANDFAMTSARKDTNVVRLNANAFRNKEKLAEEYQKLVDEGWFVKGTTYRSIIIHEMGHVYANIHKTDILEIAKKVLKTNYVSSVFDYLTKNFSEYSYAYADGSEIISEVFSSFYSGSKDEFAEKFIRELLKGGNCYDGK